jgi:hypothetical protein
MKGANHPYQNQKSHEVRVPHESSGFFQVRLERIANDNPRDFRTHRKIPGGRHDTPKNI